MNTDKVYNYDNTFIRSVGVGLSKTLNKHIRWINRFENTKIRVVLPFYFPLTNDEDFTMDAFIDDITGQRVEGNTDQIPRGVITTESFKVVSSEFANPNQYISQEVEINDKYKKIYSKLKAVPVNLNYSIEIHVSSQEDLFKAWQKTIESLFNYHYFRIDYLGIPLDCVLELPDDNTITMPSEVTLETDERKIFTFNLLVRTYMPIFKVNIDDLEICDNDDEIDWSRLGVDKPDGKWCDNDTDIVKRVYWYNIINSLDEHKIVRTKADGKPSTWNKFNID